GPGLLCSPRAPGVVGPDHRRTPATDHCGEQPHLGGDVVLHAGVMLEVIARQVGEGAGSRQQRFGAGLAEAVAPRLQRPRRPARPVMFERDVTMSGVVSPVDTLSSGVVTPRVPIEAERWPHIRQICRVISTVDVLPLVPVTATTVSGTGRKNCAARRAKARRGCGSGRCTAPVTAASGLATTAIAPAATAAGMKSSPLAVAPWKAPNTVPGATLRWSMAKPVTVSSPKAPASIIAVSAKRASFTGRLRPAASGR